MAQTRPVVRKRVEILMAWATSSCAFRVRDAKKQRRQGNEKHLHHPQPAALEHGIRGAADDPIRAVGVAVDLADPLEVDVHSELIRD